ncbi:hypothetical protein Syun_015401 [Stephania yunnanensis]|uniref:Uncharacterized protein n=1 Tax=Stephania yunnanensis TaxID=152371 RepID=A0AAP0JL34_9MAGN
MWQVEIGSTCVRTGPLPSLPHVATFCFNDTVFHLRYFLRIACFVLHGRLGLGGIAIVHYNNTPFDQYSIIRSAKSRRIPFASDTIFKSPSDFIDSGDDFASSPCVFVTQNGDSKSELLVLVLSGELSGAKRGGLGAVGERGGWGGGGCVQCERCGEDSGFRNFGPLSSLGPMGISWWGAAMGTRFVLASSKRGSWLVGMRSYLEATSQQWNKTRYIEPFPNIVMIGYHSLTFRSRPSGIAQDMAMNDVET